MYFYEIRGAYILGFSQYFSEKEVVSKWVSEWHEKRNTSNGEIPDLRPSGKICTLMSVC